MCEHTVATKHAIFPELWALQRFKTAKLTFSLTQGHWPRFGMATFKFRRDLWRQKTRVPGLSCGCLHDPKFSRFDTIPACDRPHTYRQTNTWRRYIPR